MHSMTGFGSSQIKINENETLFIEIRSLNSRFLDIKINIPETYSHIEKQIRSSITENILRGKIEVKIGHKRNKLDNDFEKFIKKINNHLNYIKQNIPNTSPPNSSEIINIFYKNKDQLLYENMEINENIINSAIIEAINNLQKDRIREGSHLSKIIKKYVEDISTIIKKIELYIDEDVSKYQEKLSKKIENNINELFPNGLTTISSIEIKERIFKESSVNALKTDISEELDRLRIHLQEILNITHLKNETIIGKKIEYLTQEMGREINTLGSKSTNIKISHYAIDIKLIIEKIREQSQNIE
ncbi:YicC-like stress-induced protein [Candidatus Kinetoplastibacterium desouzaii TCC079E]|uniref:YicC-like stress-induced protein n=1 Tax=Candidatus Kinetoplastidibacterium desouzai TCC079E TaxID=1208919 RepID=M1LRU6_9PROT|nr:DUF1732 domain-containing protein [Candidatus Kinetoplastibacterium desouzaii]AGF46866.1 YicC-like stress-induced protein [Candidatus Kinetoplastibacterium desouzaii TCC079E]